jgi:hypothetical protein
MRPKLMARSRKTDERILNKISTKEMEVVDIRGVIQLLHVPLCDVECPHGPIDLLVGLNEAQLHPASGKHKVGNLRLLQSQFGTGALLEGAHPAIKPKQVRMTKLAHVIKMIDTSSPIPKSVKNKVNLLMNNVEKEHPEFLEAKEMGLQCPRRCNRCSNCSDCSMSAQHLTNKEQSELVMTEAHSQHHRDAKDTLWRSRSMTWIIQGKKLSKKICSACLLGKIRAKEIELSTIVVGSLRTCQNPHKEGGRHSGKLKTSLAVPKTWKWLKMLAKQDSHDSEELLGLSSMAWLPCAG